MNIEPIIASAPPQLAWPGLVELACIGVTAACLGELIFEY